MFQCFDFFPKPNTKPVSTTPDPSNNLIHHMQNTVDKLQEEVQGAIRSKQRLEEQRDCIMEKEMEKVCKQLSDGLSQMYEALMTRQEERIEWQKKRGDVLEKRLLKFKGSESQKQKQSVPKKPTCGLCRLEFTTNRTPRFLRCGHTLCESCLNQIFSKCKGKSVKCPFDKKITQMGKGGPIDLPKNFTVLEMLKDLE